MTWPKLFATLVALVGAFSGGQAIIWSQHTAQPHPGAAQQRQLEKFEDKIDGKLDRILRKVGAAENPTDVQEG